MIPAGDWLDWLEFNFCRPCGVTRQTAWIYMKIDIDNAQLRDRANAQRVLHGSPDFKLVSELKFDTIRKHALSFTPKKLAHDRRPRLATFRKIVKEYETLKELHLSGRQVIDFDEAREDLREIYRFLRWLHGDDKRDPWA